MQTVAVTHADKSKDKDYNLPLCSDPALQQLLPEQYLPLQLVAHAHRCRVPGTAGFGYY